MKKNIKILIAVIAAAVVMAGVLAALLLIPKDGSSDSSSASADQASAVAGVSGAVDGDGVHQVKIENEKISEDSEVSGALMEYVPADISTIHLENSEGTLDIISETPVNEDGSTEETVYTIKGYEDFDLQDGNPDMIANAAASLEFTQIASTDVSNLSDYGLDKPRATITVTYTDKTKAVIYIGNDAPQGKGTYVKFGDNNDVFVVSSDTAAVFDYGVTDLISLTINDSAEDTDTSQASSITLTGKAFPNAVVLEPYTGDKSSASYVMTAPENRFANESESSLVEGAIRGLYADSVKAVNPSESQLKNFGLSSPYAELKAVYSDLTVELKCSKPDGDGNVYLMKNGGNVVYQMTAEKLAWSQTSYEKLLSEYVLYPKMASLANIDADVDGKTYSFTLRSNNITSEDEDGNETDSTVTTVKYGDTEIETADFSTFYDELTLIEAADSELESASGEKAMSVKYTYSDGSTDTVSYYTSGSSRYVAELNGRVIGHAYKAKVINAVNELKKLVS